MAENKEKAPDEIPAQSSADSKLTIRKVYHRKRKDFNYILLLKLKNAVIGILLTVFLLSNYQYGGMVILITTIISLPISTAFVLWSVDELLISLVKGS